MTIGEKYIIDKGFRNSGEVTLIKIYGKKDMSRKHCRITSKGERVFLVLFHDNPDLLLERVLIEICRI